MKLRKLIYTLVIALTALSFQAIASQKDATVTRTTKQGEQSGGSNGVIIRQKSSEAPAGTPTRAIQDLESKMDNFKTGTHLSEQDKARNQQIKREIITGIFNIQELSRLALDKHWSQRTPAEQSSFVTLMTQLLEKKAILSKEQSKTQGKKYFIRYQGDTYLDAPKSRAKSRTVIHVPKEDVDISIDYKLVKNGSEWKIFDVIVDDASLVDNYRYQFNSIISKYGYPELVSRMQKKLTDLDSKS